MDQNIRGEREGTLRGAASWWCINNFTQFGEGWDEIPLQFFTQLGSREVCGCDHAFFNARAGGKLGSWKMEAVTGGGRRRRGSEEEEEEDQGRALDTPCQWGGGQDGGLVAIGLVGEGRCKRESGHQRLAKFEFQSFWF